MLLILYLIDQQLVSEMFMLVPIFQSTIPYTPHLSLATVQSVRILLFTCNRKLGLNRWRLFFSFNGRLGRGILELVWGPTVSSRTHVPSTSHFTILIRMLASHPHNVTVAPGITSLFKSGRRSKERSRYQEQLCFYQKSKNFPKGPFIGQNCVTQPSLLQRRVGKQLFSFPRSSIVKVSKSEAF